MITSNLKLIGGAAILAGALWCAGCNNERTDVPRPPAAGATASSPQAPKGTSPVQPPHALPPREPKGSAKVMGEVDTGGVRFTDSRLELTGVSFAVPLGWLRETPQAGSGMFSASRKAQFRLPKADDEPEDVVVAITHFPGMRGMDEANLRRWYGQFVQPDGRRTIEVVTRADFQVGNVVVALVDIPGTMSAGGTMMGGKKKEDYRMLAAVINHARGPHFFKLTGPAAGVERWKASAVAFLKSARAKE